MKCLAVIDLLLIKIYVIMMSGGGGGGECKGAC